MPKRKQANFFGTDLPLPRGLVSLCLEYCCYRYCITCHDVFPQNFKCLSCPNLSSVTCYFLHGFTTNENHTKTFDDFLEQLVWDYVQLKLPYYRSYEGAYWKGKEFRPYKLKLTVCRKRTRSNNEWWQEEFRHTNDNGTACTASSQIQTSWSQGWTYGWPAPPSKWVKTLA